MTVPASLTKPAWGTALRLSVWLGLALWFLWPAARASWPHAPVPLDDVYIHLDYASSFSWRQPFAWLPGQGYSSGETAPLYALLLATLHTLGARGDLLAWGASALAALSTVAAAEQLSRLGRDRWLAAWPASSLLLFGALSWGLLSAMELGVYALCVATAVRLAFALERHGAASSRRARAALAACLAALVALRPESLILVALLACATATACRSTWRGRVRQAFWFAAPAVAVQTAVFCSNYLHTGELQSAGALLKLLAEDPALDPPSRVREVLSNLVHSYFGAFVRSSAWPVLAGCGALGAALCALWPRQGRGVALALALAAPLLALLVSFNGAARYQGFRYYVPALLCLVALACHGAPRLRSRALAFVVCALPLLSFAIALPWHRDHFARAARNIAEQQVQVGLQLRARTAPDARLLIGDAGAIPYFAQRSAIDALGLGGFHGVPFVRAARHGEAATLELLEQLPAAERPTHLALYRAWFPAITEHFGVPWFEVSIDDPVIVGAPVKSVLRADWSALGPHLPAALQDHHTVQDALDFAELGSERAHGVGWGSWVPTRVEVRHEDGARRFDGCRELGAGQELWWRDAVPSDAPTQLTLWLRGVGLVAAQLAQGERSVPLQQVTPERAHEHAFGLARAEVERGALRLRAGDQAVRVCSAFWTDAAPAR